MHQNACCAEKVVEMSIHSQYNYIQTYIRIALTLVNNFNRTKLGNLTSVLSNQFYIHPFPLFSTKMKCWEKVLTGILGEVGRTKMTYTWLVAKVNSQTGVKNHALNSLLQFFKASSFSFVTPLL